MMTGLMVRKLEGGGDVMEVCSDNFLLVCVCMHEADVLGAGIIYRRWYSQIAQLEYWEE